MSVLFLLFPGGLGYNGRTARSADRRRPWPNRPVLPRTERFPLSNLSRSRPARPRSCRLNPRASSTAGSARPQPGVSFPCSVPPPQPADACAGESVRTPAFPLAAAPSGSAPPEGHRRAFGFARRGVPGLPANESRLGWTSNVRRCAFWFRGCGRKMFRSDPEHQPVSDFVHIAPATDRRIGQAVEVELSSIRSQDSAPFAARSGRGVRWFPKSTRAPARQSISPRRLLIVRAFR